MNTHRLRLSFEEGAISVSLICPDTGCEPVTNCGDCGRPFGDTHACANCEIERESAPECWLRQWVEAVGPGEVLEWMQGEVTIGVNGIFDCEEPTIEVYEPDRALAALTWQG